MKNPTAGSTSVMLNSIYAAQAEQSFIYRNWEVETSGNPLAHAVLRGYIGLDGRTYPNYHYEHLERLAQNYTADKYANPAVIVDCNHDNSGKRPLEQLRICKEVLDSCRRNDQIRGIVRGFMVESYLEDGNQPVVRRRVGQVHHRPLPRLGKDRPAHPRPGRARLASRLAANTAPAPRSYGPARRAAAAGASCAPPSRQSGVSAWLGITEPAIFGVNLKLRFPFYAALIGGGHRRGLRHHGAGALRLAGPGAVS